MLQAGKVASTRWLISRNTTTRNFDAGVIAFDGANNNVILHNVASMNGLAPFPPKSGPRYDIELVGRDNRWGACVPASYSNLVIVGDPTITVNDCGTNNTVIGGRLITPSYCPFPCK